MDSIAPTSVRPHASQDPEDVLPLTFRLPVGLAFRR